MDSFCIIEKNNLKTKKREKTKIFFIEKYQPIEKDDFIIHNKIVNKISNFVNGQDNNLMNTFIFGKSDSGKYTIFKFLLKEYYKNDITTHKQTFTFDGKELDYLSGPNHFEIHLNAYNSNHINLYKNFLKQVITPINAKTFDNKKNIILIKNINLFKNDILKILKYYLDKHYNNIFILIGEYPIKDLEGFFFNIRVPRPDEIQITKFLKKIIKKENLQVKKKELNYIIRKGERKISKTINLLENSYTSGEYIEYFNSNDKTISLIYRLIKNADILILKKIRELINQLLINNISITYFLKELVKKISNDKNIESNDKLTCINYIIESEHNFRLGYREIFHIEYCVIRIINQLNSKK